jgi:isopenicillin-N epimerase
VRTAEDIRSDFLLDPTIAHLNHGSYGAVPRPVRERQRQLQDELERDPDEFLGRRLPEALAGACRDLAAFVGVDDPDSLVLVPNATTALNAVASSVPLAAGDDIVLTNREYGAMRLLWDEIARRTGARVVVAAVPLPAENDTQVADALWSAVTPRTRVLFFSHVTSETALVLPADELCRRARDAGILTVVDGAHGPGQLPLTLDDLGADCYAGNGHKWLCAPKGSAFLYVREELHDALRPAIVSWGWEDGYQQRFGWSGTDDPTALLTLPAAIDYQATNGWPGVRDRCRELARKTHEVILERLGGDPIASSELQAPQMIAFPVPHADPVALQRELRDSHRVEIPVREVDGRTIVRLSVQGYTTEDDCRRLGDALIACTRDSRRSGRWRGLRPSPAAEHRR